MRKSDSFFSAKEEYLIYLIKGYVNKQTTCYHAEQKAISKWKE